MFYNKYRTRISASQPSRLRPGEGTRRASHPTERRRPKHLAKRIFRGEGRTYMSSIHRRDDTTTSRHLKRCIILLFPCNGLDFYRRRSYRESVTRQQLSRRCQRDEIQYLSQCRRAYADALSLFLFLESTK